MARRHFFSLIVLLTFGLTAWTISSSTAAAALPSQFFPPDNVWNTDISSLPVHSMSATWIATVGASKNLHVGFYPDQWGMRYNLVDANTPMHTVRIVGQDPIDSDLIPYPFTAQTLIQLGTPDAEAFMALQAENQRLKVEIEQAWNDAGLPTFLGYLRDYLDQHAGADPPPGPVEV